MAAIPIQLSRETEGGADTTDSLSDNLFNEDVNN